MSYRFYEINTRVWLKRFGEGATLLDVPLSEWEALSRLGMDYIWLMGVWQGSPEETIKANCFSPGLEGEYRRALSDYSPSDVIGSPYAISEYKVSPALGGEEGLQEVRKRLKGLGLGLVLDFVPNHFSAGSPLMAASPYLFLAGNESMLRDDPNTFFRVQDNADQIVAHGKDPFFAAWTDTAQVNYADPRAREFMLEQLFSIAELCDGVRCDMAMLVLADVFSKTWGFALGDDRGVVGWDFWQESIAKIKAKNRNFLFMAEVYWDMEWQLQQLGFDATYDKRLYDRLVDGDVAGIRAQFEAGIAFQGKLLRFIENHDEPRAAAVFADKKSEAAAVVFSTLPGHCLFYDGQLEGKRLRLPVQLGREPVEPVDLGVQSFYQQLLEVLKMPLLRKGDWRQLQLLSAGDDSFSSLIAYCWRKDAERLLIVVNYSEVSGRCHVQLAEELSSVEVGLVDLISGENYRHLSANLREFGLFVELQPFGYHIFKY